MIEVEDAEQSIFLRHHARHRATLNHHRAREQQGLHGASGQVAQHDVRAAIAVKVADSAKVESIGAGFRQQPARGPPEARHEPHRELPRARVEPRHIAHAIAIKVDDRRQLAGVGNPVEVDVGDQARGQFARIRSAVVVAVGRVVQVVKARFCRRSWAFRHRNQRARAQHECRRSLVEHAVEHGRRKEDRFLLETRRAVRTTLQEDVVDHLSVEGQREVFTGRAEIGLDLDLHGHITDGVGKVARGHGHGARRGERRHRRTLVCGNAGFA